MKSKIKYSTYSVLLTTVVLTLLLICCIIKINENPLFYPLVAIFAILLITGLFYGSSYIKADTDYIILGSPLKCKKIPMCNVSSVEPFQPTMGAIRVLGSGGFMGYWGIFKEGDIGKYYGFYGKSSDCFLICMKDESKYVIGCEHPEDMIEYIKTNIQ